MRFTRRRGAGPAVGAEAQDVTQQGKFHAKIGKGNRAFSKGKNCKSEILSTKSETSTNYQNLNIKTAIAGVLSVGKFGFLICFAFRISTFEFYESMDSLMLQEGEDKMRELRIKVLLPEYVYQFGIWAILLYRRLRYGEAFRLIPLTKGLYAIVSPEDYERISAYKWYADKHDNTWYAIRWVRSKANPKMQYRVRMHREVLSPPDDLFVDHRNHNGLDNRRSNLRIATLAENGCNKRKTSSRCTSQFKGVCWWKLDSKWRAQGRLNGKQIIIGYFDNELDAAKAYDAWAIQAFGQFAALNFPQQKDPPAIWRGLALLGFASRSRASGGLGDWSFRICYCGYTG